MHPCGSVVVVVIGAHYGPSRDDSLLALEEVFDRSRLVRAAIRVQGGRLTSATRPRSEEGSA